MEGTSSTSAPSADRGGATAAPYRQRWIVATVVLAAATMDLLDATIVNVAGPSIRRDLGGGASTLQWLSLLHIGVRSRAHRRRAPW
jgi:hypothetical protein